MQMDIQKPVGLYRRNALCLVLPSVLAHRGPSMLCSSQVTRQMGKQQGKDSKHKVLDSRL